MGFFSGFAITTLVAIMQSPATFHVAVGSLSAVVYFESLITAVAIMGSACVFGILATVEVAGGTAEPGSRMAQFGYGCFLTGLFGLVTVLPPLIVPFTEIGPTIVIAFEIALLIVYFAPRSTDDVISGVKPGPGWTHHLAA